MSFRLRLEFKAADCWVGLFWKRSTDTWAETEGREAIICTAPRLDVWVCIIPMCPLHLVFQGATDRSDPVAYVAKTETLTEIAARHDWLPFGDDP